MRVQKKAIQKWCDALRSGEYKQGEESLQNDKGFCCLGVACKVFIPESKIKRKSRAPTQLFGPFPSHQSFAPMWLKDININFEARTMKRLSILNDSGEYNFNEIADMLEAVYIHEVLK